MVTQTLITKYAVLNPTRVANFIRHAKANKYSIAENDINALHTVLHACSTMIQRHPELIHVYRRKYLGEHALWTFYSEVALFTIGSDPFASTISHHHSQNSRACLFNNSKKLETI